MTARDTLNAAMSEADFQSRVIARAKARGWMVHHARPSLNRSGKWSTAIQGHKGFPDLVLARWPRVLILELKAQRGRLSDDQHEWLGALGWFDGDLIRWDTNRVIGVGVVRPSDWPLVCSILDQEVTS